LSLLVVQYLSDGIILQADRKISFNQFGIIKESYFSSQKIYVVNSKVALGYYGTASIKGKTMSSFFSRFIQSVGDDVDIHDIPFLLTEKLGGIVSGLCVCLVGFSSRSGETEPVFLLLNETSHYCNGHKNHFSGVPDIYPLGEDFFCHLLSVPIIADKYPISFGSLGLQEGIDLGRFLIQTTHNLMKFSVSDVTVSKEVDTIVLRNDKEPEQSITGLVLQENETTNLIEEQPQ